MMMMMMILTLVAFPSNTQW